ncbi:MAG: histidine phosphatase family protein [Candidatus Saccharimonadales bacterium]
MKHLYFARHGLSEMNKIGLFAGQIETPLTTEGRHQAKQAGIKAQELGIDHIITSPYSRTLDTAKIIATEIGLPLNNIETNRLFVERNLGALEGTPYHAKLDLDIDGVTDIETAVDLQYRLELAWQYLKSLKYDTVLVIGHGASGRMLRHVINPEIPFKFDTLALKDHYKLGNAEIVQLI